MTQELINQLVTQGSFPNNCKAPNVVETHASWVILTDDFAFKVKKPVRYSFLDFSTLAKRKYFCEEELKLNRRLSNIYLSVVPIKENKGLLGIGISGKTVEYAVQMQRLPSDRQMHNLLENDAVKEEDVRALGEMIAEFHLKAIVIRKPFDLESTEADFADIAIVIPVLSKVIDENFSLWVKDWISIATSVLLKYKDRFSERVQEGFIRDGHGDLHSGNIFLLEKPIIFDCIEFNEHFRINDVLSELAFLAMDLERYGRKDLQEILTETYKHYFQCFLKPADEIIFKYYLLYRASVRLKIAALKVGKESPKRKGATQQDIAEITTLANLCRKYAEQLRPLV